MGGASQEAIMCCFIVCLEHRGQACVSRPTQTSTKLVDVGGACATICAAACAAPWVAERVNSKHPCPLSDYPQSPISDLRSSIFNIHLHCIPASIFNIHLHCIPSSIRHPSSLYSIIVVLSTRRKIKATWSSNKDQVGYTPWAPLTSWSLESLV